MFRLDVSAAEFEPEFLLNMKEMHLIAKVDSPPKDVFNIVCDNIIAKMIDHENIDIITFRDNLYDILLYGLDVTECLWYILYHFVENGILVEDENPDGLSGSKSNVPRFASVSPPSEDIRRSFDSGNALSEIMDKTDAFLKFYNNNYRPIYHLESMFIYLITKIYRYPNELKTST